jgi:D-alanyl-lipoteichoic acid acyltransferase DltB (MBOAT superfamily)
MPYSNWILPVGISFYTFQSLSYTIDVFRGEQPAERNLGKYALFVSFFPQLVAGPIERSTALLPQFDEHHQFNYDRVVSGLRLMAWGLFKKIVVADQLAVLVNGVYNEPSGLVGPHFVLATVFFAFQIYCDFSGYSDVAIGAAQVLGFKLMMNFNRPYVAQSVSEFWSRWHISLSTWFRDYLYIPLGGNRASVPRWYVNVMVVFLVSGLWHGAKWTFVVWGVLHGIYLIFSLITKSFRERAAIACGLKRVPLLHAALRTLVVFALVCFAWIFFRANSLTDAMYIVSHLTVGWENLLHAGWLREARIDLGVSDRYLALAVGLIVLLNAAEYFHEHHHFGDQLGRRAWPVRWAVYASLVLAIINLGAPKAEPFIYFQF